MRSGMSVAELNALPKGSVVIDACGDIWLLDVVGEPTASELAWFPLIPEVGYKSSDVGDGAKLLRVSQ